MRNSLVKLYVLLLLTLFAVSAQPSPLIEWRFSQSLDLTQEMLTDSRLDAVFINDDLILVTSPQLNFSTNAGSTNACGVALLFMADTQGNFSRLQTLSASDFGMACAQQDGFGFSVAYRNGLLVIGAPGQVFTAPGQSLSDGSVYIYRLDDDDSGTISMVPISRIAGNGENNNRAWGTRVETNGELILVQGNQAVGVEQRLVHDRALAQTVNLLAPTDQNNWVLTQQFSDTATIYGDDFLIQNQTIFINSHEFTQRRPGFINVPEQNFYQSEVQVYEFNDTSNMYMLDELINAGNIGVNVLFNPNLFGSDALLDIDQLYFDNNRLIVSKPIFAAFDGNTEVLWYELNSEQAYEEISSVVFFGQSRQLISGLAGIDAVGIFSNILRDSIRVISAYSPIKASAPEVLRQRLVADNNRPLPINQSILQLNQSNNRLLSTEEDQGMRQVVVSNAKPALDPAITGLWWFGPEFNGQGITLEVLRNNRLLLHWFTYDSSGNQMWMRGTGIFENGIVKLPLVRARGPRFPIGRFNPADRVVEPWGMAEIEFSDCRNGEIRYTSEEFGNGVLPISSLVDNELLCDRGFIIDQQATNLVRRFDIRRTGSPARSMIGSSFDLRRSGEGFIFMPAMIDNSDPMSRMMVGLWLTYDQLGNQAWYYLGLLENCSTSPLSNVPGCRWQLTDQPRRSEGPVFGPDYNPADRVIMPWGEFGDLQLVRNPLLPDRLETLLLISFDNPDGAGTLRLDKLTDPIGY